MSENLRNFTKAIYGMDAVVQRVPADAWDNDSPCEGWTARDVVGHQAGVLNGVAQIARTGEMAMPAPPDDVSDPLAVWAEARDGVLEALDAKGVLNQEGTFWFGPMSVDGLIGAVQWDPLTHAWDISKATGVEAVIDAGLAQQSHDRISAMRDGLAKMGLVGEQVLVSDDADIVSRYLGLVGRDPS
jgi:uncharacterized protein (TIGR03086 family)